MGTNVRWFQSLRITDVPVVGGKNASLGEMVSALAEEGIAVPDGFATTAEAFRRHLTQNGLDEQVSALLERLDEGAPLADVGSAIRGLIGSAPLPDDVGSDIRIAYSELALRSGRADVDVAVRSSATAEDLPDASFAGQQETFLNVRGEAQVLEAVRRCMASLYTDRAISYREEKGFAHEKVALSVGVQRMVRSDLAGSGVLFTIDTETGFPNVVVIDATWGLGEYVVKGTVDPDGYVVFKPLLDDPSLIPILEKRIGAKERKLVYAEGGDTVGVDTTADERSSAVLSDDEILRLARWGQRIEKHYGRAMDVEWAKDGVSGELFVVQARPETVQSRTGGGLRTYTLRGAGQRLASGPSVGDAVASGAASVIAGPEDFGRFPDGGILVTEMTDPDWGPLLRRAAGIVTDHGGRTCHAAIVAREFGIPAVVGTGNATSVIADGQSVTISCAEGDEGSVYDGIIPFEVVERDMSDLPSTRTQIMLNVASPATAFRWWKLPARGIGLARMEFVINDVIKVHPLALTRYEELHPADRHIVDDIVVGYDDRTEYFVDHLARGLGKIAASQYPDPVIVRMSDFKTNEYANLIGGRGFEPFEANPMLGFRGASRYYSDRYRDGFELECRAIRRVRETMGLRNVIVMIPFCRTLGEADRVLETMASFGLERGQDGLKVYVMAEVPSNVVLAEGFAARFDGFSIGSNDLTQLILGIDRDSGELAMLFDERNEAVTSMIADLISRAHACGATVGICGQAPSDFPDFAAFLVEAGIDSMSLNPDSVVRTVETVAEAERKLERKTHDGRFVMSDTTEHTGLGARLEEIEERARELRTKAEETTDDVREHLKPFIDALNTDRTSLREALKRLKDAAEDARKGIASDLRRDLEAFEDDVVIAREELARRLAENRETYRDAARAELEAWRARIDHLRVQADLGRMEARDDVREMAQRADTAYATAKRWLEDAAEDTGETLEGLRSGFDALVADVREAVEDGKRRYREAA